MIDYIIVSNNGGGCLWLIVDTYIYTHIIQTCVVSIRPCNMAAPWPSKLSSWLVVMLLDDVHWFLVVAACLPSNRQIVLPPQTGHPARPDQPQSGSHPGLPDPHFYPAGIGCMSATLTVCCTTGSRSMCLPTRFIDYQLKTIANFSCLLL